MLSQSGIARAWGPPCRGPYARISLHGTGRVTVKASIVEATKALNAILVRYNYRTQAHHTGAMNCRKKVGGSGWSNHSYGTAIDINWQRNPYSSRLRTDMPLSMPRDICRIRTNNGRQVWNWGGYWRGSKDAMHYEIVCSPRDLATGINWGTVSGRVPSRIPAPPVRVSTPTKPAPKSQPTQEDEEEMSSIIQHHNNEMWLYNGLLRSHLHTQADVDFYKFLGAKFSSLKSDPRASQRMLNNSVDIQNINKSTLFAKSGNDNAVKAAMFSEANNGILRKIASKLGVKV